MDGGFAGRAGFGYGVGAVRNKYAGTCYRCGAHVAVGKGHFERYQGGWRTQHAECAIEARKASK